MYLYKHMVSMASRPIARHTIESIRELHLARWMGPLLHACSRSPTAVLDTPRLQQQVSGRHSLLGGQHLWTIRAWPDLQ